jgi:hypothetical protein
VPRVGVQLEKIPLESGTVLVYAPTVPSACCPNDQLIAVLEAINGGCYATAIDAEGAGIGVLTALGMVSGDDSLRTLPVPSGSQPGGALVVAVDLRGVLDDLGVEGTGSSAFGHSRPDLCDRRAGLFAAVEAVYEKAVARGCSSIALDLRLAGGAPSCWSLAANLAAHARTLAHSGTCSVRVRRSLRAEDLNEVPLKGNIDFESLTLALSSRELFPATAGRTRPAVPEMFVRLNDAFRATGASVRLQLAVDLVSLKHLGELVGALCRAMDAVEIEVVPEFVFSHESHAPSDAAQQLLAAFRDARRVARNFQCALSFPGACPERLEDFTGTEPADFILPIRNSTGGAEKSRSALAEMRSPTKLADPRSECGHGPTLPRGELAHHDKEHPVRPACCRSCFARHNCTPGAAAEGPAGFQGSSRCSVIRELLKEELLLRVADGGGLGWIGTPSKASIEVIQRAGWSATIEVPGRHDAAWARSDALPPPGLYPVLTLPWEGRLTRRAFLGVSIAAGLALATFRTRALAVCPDECAVRPDAPACLDGGIDVAMPAGVQVAPSLLSAVGIAAGADDTIEEGFHLRWFLGKELRPPVAAFPAGISSVRAFVDLKFDRTKPPELIIEPPSPPQPQRATVTGRVLDRSDRNPIEGATVKLLGSNGETLAETTTDRKGSYELRNVKQGCYALGVGKARFRVVIFRNLGIYGIEEQLRDVLIRRGNPSPPEINDVNPRCPDPPQQDHGKPGYNESVPPAFHIFRREHHPHFDRPLDISQERLNQLRSVQEAIPLDAGIRASVEKRNPVSATPPQYELEWPPSPPGWPPSSGPVTYPNWVRGAEAEVLVLQFVLATSLNTPRVVHFARLTSIAQSLGRPDAIVVELYADGDAEPLRQETVAWSRDGLLGWNWKLNWVIDQGHCDTVKVVARVLFPLRLEYSFMDEDAKIASDPEHPLRGEWIQVASTPHITYFQSWEFAKDECFRHEIKNRFLDFKLLDDKGWRGRLDKKYKPWLATLQQAFLRLRLAQLLDQHFLTDRDSASLTELRYEPYFMLQMWALDPILARMLGQAFSDIPDLSAHPQNPNAPSLGKTYDYMVTTAWQTQACRLLYITQKVSMATTPPVPSITTLSPRQLDAQVTESGRRLYQVALSWKAAQGGSTANANYEAPLFDVSRGSSPSGMWSLTHYVENDGDVVDAPVHPALSVPHLRSDDPPNRFSPSQRDALQLMQTLQARDAHSAITRAQVTALEAMQGAPAATMFRLQEPDARFMEWLPAPPAERECEDVYYSVRSIDLFGRTSGWSESARLQICHRTPPAAPVSVQARLTGSDGGQQLMLSWRYGAGQTRASGPVSHFSVLAAAVTSETSRPAESQWKEIKTDVAFEAAIAVNVDSVDAIEDQSIAGTIIDARSTSGELAVEEEGRLLGANKRLVYLTTSQCFFGTPPRVDIPQRWSGRDELLDKLKLTIQGIERNVVAFEGGEVLRLGIVVEAPATEVSEDPAAPFRTTPPTAFLLTFKSVKSQLAWEQRFSGAHLPEASVGVAAQMDSDARARHLAARRTLEIVLSVPVDVTGREQWLTSGAVLELTHQGPAHRAPILDFALDSTSTGTDPNAPTMQLLRRLTLGQVIRDLPAGSSEANPQPALPLTLLRQALENPQGVQLHCAISVPPLQSVQVAVTADPLAQPGSEQSRLLAARGADLLLEGQSQRAEEPSHQQVTAVSQVGNNRFVFLVREMRADRAVMPLAEGQRATLYPVYRQAIDVAANSLFARDSSEAAKRRHLKLAVRAHASYGAKVSPPSNMVSLTVAPSAPEVSPLLLAQGDCEDPFKVVDYTSLPKVLNNRKVVQYKLVPKEILKRHAETSGIPEVSLPSGAMEVLRASEDRIRLAANLGGDAAYCAIATALVKEWASSPEIRGAFEPVGRLSETNAEFIDEVEGTASGNLYYAIRSIREGGVPSNIQLLPIRVEIPDLSRPPPPQRVRRIASERVVTLQVEYPKTSKTSGLFLYRSDSMQRDSDLVAMIKIAVVTLAGQSLDKSLFAPLRLEVVNKRNRVVAGKISNWFPVSPRPLEVLGVFRRGDFNPAAIPMNLQASPNLFQADQGSVFDLNTGEIRGLGFSQDCAWEKRFSFGEQPKTAWSC